MSFELTKEEMEVVKRRYPKTESNQQELEEAEKNLKYWDTRVKVLQLTGLQIMQEEGHWFMDIDHPMHKIHKDMFEFMQKKKEGKE